MSTSQGRAQAVAAAPEAAGVPDERERARDLVYAGDQLRAAGDVRGALQRYQEAHALMRVPTTGVEVAQAHADLLELVEARTMALDMAHSPKVAGEPAIFAQARRRAAQLADELLPRIASLRIVVTPSDIPYEVMVDDITLPPAARALPVRVNPGTHRLLVWALGFAPVRRGVILAEAEQRVVPVQLQRADEAPPPVEPHTKRGGHACTLNAQGGQRGAAWLLLGSAGWGMLRRARRGSSAAARSS